MWINFFILYFPNSRNKSCIDKRIESLSNISLHKFIIKMNFCNILLIVHYILSSINVKNRQTMVNSRVDTNGNDHKARLNIPAFDREIGARSNSPIC